ncbi:rod shape-determining protein MreD [Spartinivicinus marinus]|nr:rod shape-determining protein MreD [Spartinivicinus marinus]MCX4028202.1 rod shape-determining protein MreD [Spartinivicinus marinus]
MSTDRPQGRMVIWTTIFFAYVLSLLPMPSYLELGRPEWLAMVMLYWALALPDRIGLILAWIVGLMLDVMQGVLLGQNALGMVIVVYVAHKLHRRMRIYPLLQQSMVVFVVIGIYQMLNLWAKSFSGRTPPNLLFLLPTVVSALLWPWLFILLRDLRRRYKVN